MNIGTALDDFYGPKIYGYDIVIMILTNGSGAIGVKFNITRMLNILPSETTKILSRGYNLLCEANSFNKNLLTIYCMLSVL